MNFLLPIRLSQGEAFTYAATVVGQDWTGYTGTATFKARPKAQWRIVDGIAVQEPIVAVPVTGNALGVLTFTLTPAQTATFPALERIGYFHRAVCEISMSNGSDVRKYQARVSVAGSI